MADHVFPEDTGTGAPDGDWNDAANFGQLADAVGAGEHVVRGMSFTLDAGTPALDISQGVAVVTDTSATATNTSEARDGVSYVVEADARTGLSLTDGATNHVYLDVDLTADDGVSFHIDTDDSAPADPALKIGTVDTSGDTTTELNRSATTVDVEDSGTGVERAGTLNFANNLSVTGDGDGYITVDASGGGGGGGGASDIIKVDDHGADDTGATQSDAAFSDAIDAADENDVVLFKDGTYLLENVHVINKKITVKAINATFNRTTGTTSDTWREDAMITFRGGGPTGTSSDLTADAYEGDNRVNVNDASLFSVGDTVAVNSAGGSGFTYYDNSETTFGDVTEVDTTNDVIRLSVGCREDHLTADGAAVFEMDMLEAPVLEGIRCEGDGSNTSSWLRMDYCRAPVVKNCHVDGFIYQAISLFDCWQGLITESSVINAYSEGASEGEAIQLFKSQDTHIRNPRVHNSRRGVDFSKRCNGAKIDNPIIHATTIAAIATHGTAGGKGIEVYGGTITDPNVDAGSILVATDGEISLTGTDIYCTGRAMWCSEGKLVGHDVTVISGQGTSSNPQEAILFDGGVLDMDMSVRQNPNNYFDTQLVHIRGDNPITKCYLNIEGEIYGDAHGIYLQTNGADVENVRLSGRLTSQTSGTGNGLWIRPLDTGETISGVNIDSLDILNHGNWVVKVNGAGTLTDVRITNSTITAGSTTAPAITFDDASFDELSEVQIANTRCVGGGTNDIEINEPDADRVWVVNNSATVSIDSNATNIVENGNQ